MRSIQQLTDENTFVDESQATSYSFTTSAESNFAVITVSLIEEEPYLKVYKSDEIKTSVPLLTKNIVKGKNLYDGTYEYAYLVPSTSKYLVDNGNTDKTAVLNIEPNKTYTISKDKSSRFRVGLFKQKPQHSNDVDNFIKVGEDSDVEFTFTSGEYTWVAIQFASSLDTHPIFLQIEEGSVATEWETHGIK